MEFNDQPYDIRDYCPNCTDEVPNLEETCTKFKCMTNKCDEDGNVVEDPTCDQDFESDPTNELTNW